MSHTVTANLRIVEQETKQWTVHAQHASWTKYKSWHLWCYTSCLKGPDSSHCLVDTQPLWNQERKNSEIAMRSGKMQKNYLVERKLQVMKALPKRCTFLLLDKFQHFFPSFTQAVKPGSPRSLSHQSQESRVVLPFWWPDRKRAWNEIYVSTVISILRHHKKHVVYTLGDKDLMRTGMEEPDMNLHRSESYDFVCHQQIFADISWYIYAIWIFLPPHRDCQLVTPSPHLRQINFSLYLSWCFHLVHEGPWYVPQVPDLS